jgi:hypothetical protein
MMHKDKSFQGSSKKMRDESYFISHGNGCTKELFTKDILGTTTISLIDKLFSKNIL